VLLSTVSTVDSARDLGVVIDSRLTMSEQVAALCRTGYYQLGQLRPVARSLPEEFAKTLVQAFISSRLDYCNSLLYGISDNLFRRLPTATYLLTYLPSRSAAMAAANSASSNSCSNTSNSHSVIIWAHQTSSWTSPPLSSCR